MSVRSRIGPVLLPSEASAAAVIHSRMAESAHLRAAGIEVWESGYSLRPDVCAESGHHWGPVPDLYQPYCARCAARWEP